MVLCSPLGMIAWHSVVGHLHRHRRRWLMSMCHLHRTAIHNERKREDAGQHSLMQAKMHDESRAKVRVNVHCPASV